MAAADYIVDLGLETDISLSQTKRKYQSSIIVVQDGQKEGILSFLKENFQSDPQPQQSSTSEPNQTFRVNRDGYNQ